MGDVNKLFVFEFLFTTPSNILPLHLKHTFLPIIWVFTEGEGDRIESSLPFKIFSTLTFLISQIVDSTFDTFLSGWKDFLWYSLTLQTQNVKQAVGYIKTTLKGSGRAKLHFGNCYTGNAVRKIPMNSNSNARQHF